MFDEVLSRLGLGAKNFSSYGGGWNEGTSGEELLSLNPATGQPLGRVVAATALEYDQVVEASRQAFSHWRILPPPQRGEIVRQIGNALREHKRDLGMLVTLETGKIKSEGLGEVQEM